MVGYALSGLVDGFFRGREVKHAWEDRKLDRERQTRLDAMEAERHAAIMGRYGREAADWDRANRLRQAETDANAAAWAATEEAWAADAAGVQTTAGAAAGAGDSAAPPAAPPPLGLRDGAPAPGSRFSTMMDRTSPAGELAARAEAEAGKTVRRPTDAPLSRPDMGRDPEQPAAAADMPARPDPREESLRDAVFGLGQDAVGYGQARVDPRLARAVGLGLMPPAAGAPSGDGRTAPAAGPRRLPDGTTVIPAPSPAIADELYQQGPVGARFLPPAAGAPTQGAAAGAAATAGRTVYVPGQGNVQISEPSRDEIDAKAADARAASGAQWRGVVQAIAAPIISVGDAINGNPNLGPNGMGLAAATPARHRPDEMAARAANAPRPAAPQLDPANPVPPMRAAAAKGASPEEARAAAAGAEAINSAVSAPTSDAARTAVVEAGVKPGREITEAQYERASKSFMDRYLEVGAPMMVEHYLKNGQTDKAVAFMAFIDSVQARENMKDWGVAAAAIAVGNVDKAADTILTAMERMDYFDDGTEVVRDQSGVIRDKDGNATGMKLTFRDTKTGTTFEQTFENMDDAISLGMTLMDPALAFEKMEAQAEAQRAAAIGLQEKAITAAQEQRKQVIDFAKTILTESKGLDGKFAITPEEALRQAQALVAGGGQSAAAPPADGWRDGVYRAP